MKSRSPSKSSPGYISQDKLKIIIRMRPILNQQDYEQFVQLQDDNTLQIKRPGICTYMKFNNILPPSSSQKDMFSLVQDSIREFLSGINMTIFAYGQTGAGKTYSMIGNYSPKDSQQNLFNFLNSKERGILSRSLEMIMSCINKKKGHRIFVSFYQIYNQKIFDLYNNNLVSLDIRESKNGQISIPDLLNVQIYSMEEAIEFLMIGLKNRATGSTHGNAQSSRSHSIFQINLQKQNQNGQIIFSSLRIVDLAGSEKFKIPSDLSTAEKQIRIQQLTSINGSLSCLGHCISALIEKSRTHVPFRNSKLTRILSDSLLGQGKMRFIICISPSLSASAETFSTLQFANRAKKAIFERTELRTPNLSKKKSSQNQEINSLKKQLQKQRQIRAHLQTQINTIMQDRPQGLIKQNAYLRKQNEKLKQQLKELMVKKQSQKGLCTTQNTGSSNDFSPSIIKSRDNPSGQNLKQQMLKLPIFQNKRSLDILQTKTENVNISKCQIKNSKAQCLKTTKQNKQIAPVNRKKAQFQKKIRRFIESDSPTNKTPTNNKSSQEIKSQNQLLNQRQSISSRAKPSPSFPSKSPQLEKEKDKAPTRKSPPPQLPPHLNSLWTQMQQANEINTYSQKNYRQNSQNYQIYPKLNKASKLQQSFPQAQVASQDQQWIENQDTQQLIEQACQKMNLPDFKDLKSQMDRAKNELLLLKQKDDQISRRKQVEFKY